MLQNTGGKLREPAYDPIVEIPERLSWSSLSTYAECGTKWLLSRGFKVPESTWFATVAGSVIHEITEEYDLREFYGDDRTIPDFKTLFDQHLSERAEEGQQVNPSGRVAKSITENGGPNKKDYDWWLLHGPQFVDRYVAWRKASDWEIATMPDGKPGIELEFTIDMRGTTIRGFIDRVMLTPNGQLVAVDLKTGNLPSGSLQLLTYAAGVYESYGLQVDWGCFWQPAGGDEGRMSPLSPLADWNMDLLENAYATAHQGIRAGVFLPQVTAMCKGCTVRPYCWAVAGEKSHLIPIPEMVEATTGEVVDDSAPLA